MAPLWALYERLPLLGFAFAGFAPGFSDLDAFGALEALAAAAFFIAGLAFALADALLEEDRMLDS
jgi:hypothetical protein